jgi:hypothetical protein
VCASRWEGGREGSHHSYSLAGSPVALQLGEYSSRPLEHLSHFVVHQLLFWCWLSLCARHDGCQGGRVSQGSDTGNGQVRLAIARGKVSTAVFQVLTKQTRQAHGSGDQRACVSREHALSKSTKKPAPAFLPERSPSTPRRPPMAAMHRSPPRPPPGWH